MFVKHICPNPQHMRIGLTFWLWNWISIGIIYSSRTIYLPGLKLLGQSIIELTWGDQHTDRLLCAKQYAPPTKGSIINRLYSVRTVKSLNLNLTWTFWSQMRSSTGHGQHMYEVSSLCAKRKRSYHVETLKSLRTDFDLHLLVLLDIW